MSKNNYKHFQAWEKLKLERLLGNKPICEPTYSMTMHGWDIIKFKWLVNISQLAFELKKERKTIKNELLRGKYWNLTKTMVEKSNYFLYSKDASDEHKRRVTQKRWIQNTKILQFKKLCNFITTHLETQSLKGIAGRSKLAYKSGSIETTISHTALYSYIDNENVKFIDSTALRRRKKQKYRLKYAGKRQNGKSIDERPEVINNRKEFGHWEMDLIEGKRGTNVNLLTIAERKSRKGIAMKIKGKRAIDINAVLKQLQIDDILIYGKNIKSATSDNGSEFWDWETFSQSIYNQRDNIEVYFTHPYCSWEKGGVEHFNGQIRRKFAKGTDFTKISQAEINKVVDWVNGLFRDSLGYLTAQEVYNTFVSN